jgi:hypothetical protein
MDPTRDLVGGAVRSLICAPVAEVPDVAAVP